MGHDFVLQLSGIHKRFGGVPALRAAHLEVRPGEVHGLVGENGAGKSTLINIATGLLRADEGEILFEERKVRFATPRQAAAAGIAVVHQEADLFAQLSIAENMLLARGLVRGPGGLINWPGTYRRAAELVSSMGEQFNVRDPAGGLSVARRMMAEIAAAVSEKARVLFLDEPTSSLASKEIKNLFAQIRCLREAGVGIVYVSHRLEEVLEICDRVTVMRDGETVETRPTEGLTMEAVVGTMVGRELGHVFSKRRVSIGDVRLSVQNLTARDGSFSNISIDVRAAEIVGLYGFVGAGRSEFAQALFGVSRPASGVVAIDGRPVAIRQPRQAVSNGLAYLPEDRLVQGVFRNQSLRTNASVASLGRLSRFGLVRRREERALAERVIRDMNVRAASQEQPLGTLSGGNQQKVVFGRWQATAPKVLLLDEPTRGVDVGAKQEIHKLIGDLAEQGTAILLISSELPEIMAMSDRVVTFSEGRKTGEFSPEKDGEEAVAAAAVPRAVEEGTAQAPTPARRLAAGMLRFREAGLLGFILLLSGVMAGLRPEGFANARNLLDILASAALPAIMAQGAMLIICTGGIDISVGSMMGLICAWAAMAAKAGWPPTLCLALAVVLGVSCSLLNGGTALLARIHPIIVTLAGISIYRGLMRIVTAGKEVTLLPDGYRALADGTILGIPKLCYYVLGVTIVTHVMLRYTLPGRRMLALGNSETAARLIGLSKTRSTLLVFAVSGALVGLAAVLQAGYYGKVQANTGSGLELKAIAAAVIGGTNILGGRGSALGTLLGAFLVALLYNMLILLEASSYWQSIFVGGLILLAVVLDALLERLRGASA
ncbi:MAG TPA: ATP-binding cassette domain-containing protein [Candidatus Hydrogenedentes bacterium]|nr:ATP-binding cassette domain-containing protein [Candidatus Hydrogenedentota bacterium]HPG67367.1 ATP-binding cassette domain-containing protein [Candidatus Hydrogenedentota bacterium]